MFHAVVVDVLLALVPGPVGLFVLTPLSLPPVDRTDLPWMRSIVSVYVSNNSTEQLISRRLNY